MPHMKKEKIDKNRVLVEGSKNIYILLHYSTTTTTPGHVTNYLIRCQICKYIFFSIGQYSTRKVIMRINFGYTKFLPGVHTCTICDLSEA